MECGGSGKILIIRSQLIATSIQHNIPVGGSNCINVKI